MDAKIREPAIGKIGAWSALVASFGLSFATWVALAVLAGFDQMVTLPWVGYTMAVAVLMPVAVDGYVASSLALWMAAVPPAIQDFARKNTYAAAGVGVVAQSTYHGVTVYQATEDAARCVLALGIGALPPLFAALSVHARALVRKYAREQAAQDVTATAEREPVPTPAAPAVTVPMPTPEVVTVPVPAAPAVTMAPVDTAEWQRQELAAWVDDTDLGGSDTGTDELAAVVTVTQDVPLSTPGTVTSQRERKELGKKLLRQGETIEHVMVALGAARRSVYRWQAEIQAEAQTVGAR